MGWGVTRFGISVLGCGDFARSTIEVGVGWGVTRFGLSVLGGWGGAGCAVRRR